MDTLDDVFELLTRERRRFVLYYLRERDGPVSVKELATTIEAWEDGSEPPALPDDRYRDILLTLKHEHLPKAAEVEFVQYDPEENVIELSGSPAEFEVVLSVAEAIEQPRSTDITTLL